MSAECGSLTASASDLAYGNSGFTQVVAHLDLVVVLMYRSHKSSLLVLQMLRRCYMLAPLGKLWREDEGQDIAEYAVMLAVILILVVGTVRLIGSNANNAFSAVASAIQ